MERLTTNPLPLDAAARDELARKADAYMAADTAYKAGPWFGAEGETLGVELEGARRAFYAACDPSVILSLLAAVERGGAERSETAWLIECPQSGGAMWWTGQDDWDRYFPPESSLGYITCFSTEANRAVRFRTKDDAMAVIRLMPAQWARERFIVTEHMWCAGPSHAEIDAARSPQPKET